MLVNTVWYHSTEVVNSFPIRFSLNSGKKTSLVLRITCRKSVHVKIPAAQLYGGGGGNNVHDNDK